MHGIRSAFMEILEDIREIIDENDTVNIEDDDIEEIITKFDTKGGNEIKEGALFCAQCGTPVNVNSQNVANTQPIKKAKNKNVPIIIAMVAVVLISAIIIIVTLASNKDEKLSTNDKTNDKTINEFVVTVRYPEFSWNSSETSDSTAIGTPEGINGTVGNNETEH